MMKESLQNAIKNELPDADYPDFDPGDRIRVTTSQVISGQRRKRQFEGVCIARRGEGPDQTFKVRKVSFGVGVERIYPLYSPIIEDIEVLKKGKVRRAKLNHLEERSAKEARIKEQQSDLEEASNTEKGEAVTSSGEEAQKDVVGVEENDETSDGETDDRESPEMEQVEEKPSEDEPSSGKAETTTNND